MTDTPTRNFMYAMLSAVNTDQSTLQWMQITDAQTTINNAQRQTDYYTLWNSILSSDAADIQDLVDGTNKNGNNPNNSKGDQGQISSAQAKYQKDSSIAQTQQSTCDATTQASQQTVGQDGSNLQNKAQLASTLNTIAASMAGMLSHAY